MACATSRGSRAAGIVALLLVASPLLAALPAAAAPLADGTPLLDSLDSGNARDDHSFDSAPGSWAVAGTLVYEQAGNTGDLRAELRQTSTAGSVLAYDTIGDYYAGSRISVLAVDSATLGVSDTFWVSELLTNVQPSYAVEAETSPTLIGSTPFVDSTSLGPNGVVESYQLYLNRRDTLEVALQVGPTYTYPYNLQVYLFGGASTPYYSTQGVGSPGPAAVSGAPANSEQHLRYTAGVGAWYLLVVANTKELGDVPFTLQVDVNGMPLSDRTAEGGTLGTYHANADYAFQNAPNDWAFVGLRHENPGFGTALTMDLHSPTFDSNVLATEFLGPSGAKAGVVAVNSYEPTAVNLSLINIRWGPNALYPATYTVEMDNGVPELLESDTPYRHTLGVGEVVDGFQVFLNASETLELHVGVDPLFTYPYEFQVYAFAPGASYKAGRATGAAGPAASAASGANTAQDLLITAPVTGFYGVAVLSLRATYAIPVDITVTIQGRQLAPDAARTGALGAPNPQDSFSFTVNSGRWGVVATRLTGGTGSYEQRLMANGFDTTPVARDTVTSGPTGLPYALQVVNGNRQVGAVPYYVAEAQSSGAPEYTVEYDSAPITLQTRNGTLAQNVPANQIVRAFEVTLALQETVDFRLTVPASFTYPYALRLFLYGPDDLFYGFGGPGAAGPLASSSGTANTEQDIVAVAPVGGPYLLVVANLGPMVQTPFDLNVTINGQPASPTAPGAGALTASNSVDYFSFTAGQAAYTVVGVKVTSATGTWSLTHGLRGPTADSVSLASDRVTALGGEGVVVVDGFGLQSNRTFFVAESAALSGTARVAYEVQVVRTFSSISSSSQVVTGTLASTAQLRGYTINLQAGQTVDLRLERQEGFSYPYDVGLYVFAPGVGNASTSGQDGAGPVASSANGPSNEQDAAFTASRSGQFLILIVNRAAPLAINFTLTVALDGWPLPEDASVSGDLSQFNAWDAYRFDAAAGAWSAAGVKWMAGPAPVRGSLHTLGLDTVPVASADANAGSTAAVIPIFARGNGTQTLFLNVTVGPTSTPRVANYLVDITGQSSVWARTDIGQTQAFNLSGSGFMALHVLQLNQGDAIDVHLLVNPAYTKTNNLDLALFQVPSAPDVVQPTPVGSSANGPDQSETLTYTPQVGGDYLLVVVNRGNVDSIPYTLSVVRHTVVGSPPTAVNLTITNVDKSSFVLSWTQSDVDDFAAYEVWIGTKPELDGMLPYDTITDRATTTDRVTYPSFKPGETYWAIVIVRDKESLSSMSRPLGTTLQADEWYENTTVQIVIAAVVAVGVILALGWWAMRSGERGKGFRWRSPKADKVVTEGPAGPKGKPRKPKAAAAAEEEPPGVPAAPPKQQQDAVSYMQRVQRGGR
jgi:hypothetical protein